MNLVSEWVYWGKREEWKKLMLGILSRWRIRYGSTNQEFNK